MTRLFILCALLALAHLRYGSPQPSLAPRTAPPQEAQATPPVPLTTPIAPTQAPPPASPTGTSPPAQAPQIATPPTTSSAVIPPASAPSTTTTPAPAGQLINPPSVAPSTSQIASAPGPQGEGSVNATVSLAADGALTPEQQQQLCQTVVKALQPEFAAIQSCSVTSQAPSNPASFSAGRRLHQTPTTFNIGLSLSVASPRQLPAIQAALNRIRITLGTAPPAPLVVLVINFVPGPSIPNGGTVPLPPNTRALPPTTNIAPAPANLRSQETITTAITPAATTNTTLNVNTDSARPPPAPANGTSTTTVVSNSTTTTTITTIAFFQVTTSVTIINQYYFTVLIGRTTGTFTIVVFNLPGNVANNLPVVVTGGAATGSRATLSVTGATVSTITSSTITTTITSTGTPGTPGTGTPGTPGTGTPGTPGTGTPGTPGTGTPGTPGTGPPVGVGGTIDGVTRQICPTPNNPSGLIQNTANEGTLIRGAFLVSTWNNVISNRPGTGNIIYQCLPNGTATVWSNVTVSGACGNSVVGLTMALSRCGSVIIAGSMPVIAEGVSSPGCLIALDLNGRTINEVTAPTINGPWGSVCTSEGNQITLALSSMLGGLSPSSASAGRRLQQASNAASGPSPPVTGGFVVRWTFTTPTLGSAWALGQPTYLVTGLQTNGPQATYGFTASVGPGGLTLGSDGTLYVPDSTNNRVLAIPKAFTASPGQAKALELTGVERALNGPNSVTFGNGNQLLGTNTQDGNLFIITLNSAGTGGTTTILKVDPDNSANVLFQAIFSVDASAGAPLGSIWFVHDGTGTLNTVINSGRSGPAPAPSPALPASGK